MSAESKQQAKSKRKCSWTESSSAMWTLPLEKGCLWQELTGMANPGNLGHRDSKNQSSLWWPHGCEREGRWEVPFRPFSSCTQQLTNFYLGQDICFPRARTNAETAIEYHSRASKRQGAPKFIRESWQSGWMMACVVLRNKWRGRRGVQKNSYNIPKENTLSWKGLFFKYFGPFGKQFIYNAYLLKGLMV